MAFSCGNLDPEQLALLAPVLAIALSQGMTADDINILSSFLTSVADAVALLAIKQEQLEAKTSPDQNSK